MMLRIPALLVLVCALGLVACNNPDATTVPNFAVDTAEDTTPRADAGGEPDVVPAEDLTPRADLEPEPDIDDEVPIGTPCSDADDCAGGYCVEGPDGGVCITSCVTECPEGYSCKGVDLFGGDLVFLCIPDWWDLCTPCSMDSDCAGDDNHCIVVPDEGQFCGLSCGDTGTCPVGYACLQAELASGDGFQWQCLPDGDTSCLCQDENIGEVKPCEHANQFGTCPVFLTSICSILGAIMFLRFGYAVGHLGLIGAIFIILLGHCITIPTG